MPFERFVEEARTAVAGAIDEAPALGHRRVGTEHLLISLASDPAAPAGAALATLGILESFWTAVTQPRFWRASTHRRIG